MIRKIIAIIVSVLFVLGIYFQDYLYDEFWVLSDVFLLILIIGILIVIFLNIKKDRLALYISIGAFLIGIGILIIQKTELFKSKIIVKAFLVDDLSGLELTLRQNNRFELLPVTYLGPCKSFTGRYKMEGDKIIFLDRPYDNKFIGDTVYMINNKIVLRFDSQGQPDTTFANYFRIDKYEKNNVR
jgi:hypothetical protein